MARRLALALVTWLLLTGSARAQEERDAEEARQRFRLEMRRIESLEQANTLAIARAAIDSLLVDWPAEPRAVAAAERIYRRQGDLASVVPTLDRAVALAPTATPIRQIQLKVLYELGRGVELRAAGEAWIAAAPNLEAAYREYAVMLRRQYDPAEAVRVLRRGLEEVGRPMSLATELAGVLVELGLWDEGAQQWLAILETSPRLGRDIVTYSLASLGPSAAPAASALLARLPAEGTVEVRELAAITALYAGRPVEARQRADSLLFELEGPARQAFIARFSEAASSQGHQDLLNWAYRKMLGELAGDASRWEVASRIVEHDLSIGDTVAARGILEEFLQRAELGTPAHRWASGVQIRLYAAALDLDRAQDALETHARTYADGPELPALALAVAEANLRGGRPEEAVQVLDWVPATRRDLGVRAMMGATRGFLALYAGDYEAARSGFEVAAAGLSGARRTEALRFLGYVRDGSPAELQVVAEAHRSAVKGQPLEALEMLSAGLESLLASRARPALLLWTVELALQGGALDTATATLQRLRDLYPEAGESPVAMMKVAEGLAAAGRRAEAIAILEQLIIEYSESALTPIGRRKLAELREEVPRS